MRRSSMKDGTSERSQYRQRFDRLRTQLSRCHPSNICESEVSEGWVNLYRVDCCNPSTYNLLLDGCRQFKTGSIHFGGPCTYIVNPILYVL
ncbi:hypothetical protein ACN38_g4082 [Penicillium nordicum]|uniref:Uncharacterized protein n=1 Tax=Penicillium nordicum TaxID=229535 RepID=A0A0M9WHG1_9EURO|nr:hypothetical protein ACN38_g4082 [Penicillium nordicum]